MLLRPARISQITRAGVKPFRAICVFFHRRGPRGREGERGNHGIGRRTSRSESPEGADRSPGGRTGGAEGRLPPHPRAPGGPGLSPPPRRVARPAGRRARPARQRLRLIRVRAGALRTLPRYFFEISKEILIVL